jgi:hypothetical protein
MKVKHQNKLRAVVPIENKDAIGFLKQNTFLQIAKAKRMIRGKPILWQPQGLYGRIAGNVG